MQVQELVGNVPWTFIAYCRCAATPHSSHAKGIPALCRTAGVSM